MSKILSTFSKHILNFLFKIPLKFLLFCFMNSKDMDCHAVL
ncbi:hypothetical protein [Helicobacter ganmani]